jgi:hypothetical protein
VTEFGALQGTKTKVFLHKYFKGERNALCSMGVILLRVVTEMFWPLMWPSTGCREQEYKHN